MSTLDRSEMTPLACSITIRLLSAYLSWGVDDLRLEHGSVLGDRCAQLCSPCQRVRLGRQRVAAEAVGLNRGGQAIERWRLLVAFSTRTLTTKSTAAAAAA